MMKTHIVIPIGVSTPGTPILSLLEKSIDSIQNQTSKDYVLTVAADTNVSEECKKLLESKNVEVKWFDPASFFRKGGIWKKITETWSTSETKYVAFLHYDDLWAPEKLDLQVRAMEEKNLSCSWSETYILNDAGQIATNDVAAWENFSIGTIGGRTAAFAHSCIVRRKEFYESGIMEFQDTWSPLFEDLFTLYLQKIGNGEKVRGAKFYWRNHNNNMSNSMFADPQWKGLMEEQRVIGEYSMQDIDKDVAYLRTRMIEVANEIRNRYT